MKFEIGPAALVWGKIKRRFWGDYVRRLQTTSETRFFALSWLPSPEVLMVTVRVHWVIENALHWQLDVSFNKDAARNRKDNGPTNTAVLPRRALDVVRRDPTKASLSMKLQ